jgi:hypothetical protein
MVHAITQLEIAKIELGFIDVGIQRVEFRLVNTVVLQDFRVKPFERLEEVPLVRVVKRLAEIEVFEFLAIGRKCTQTQKHKEPGG